MDNHIGIKGVAVPFRHSSGRASFWIIGAAALTVLVSGLWTAKQSGEAADLKMRRELVRQVSDIASTISPVYVKQLSFTAEDKDRPAFRMLCDQMAAYAEATGLRSLYTMALRNGLLVFGPESLPEGHPYASPPGKVYQDPSQKDFDIFETARPQIQGPDSDVYGTFVTATVPVFDHVTSKVLMVVGVDVEADVWRAAVRRAQLIPGGITLALLLLLLLSGLIIRARHRVSPSRTAGLRHTETVLCALFLSAVTFSLAMHFYKTEKDARLTMFHSMAQARAFLIRSEFYDMDSTLAQLVSFFEASREVDRDEFSSYCRNIMLSGVMQRCLWIPEVQDGERESFIQSAKNGGLTDFSIWQKDAAGRREPAPVRSVYYPVFFQEPSSGALLFGYDEMSDPIRGAAIRQAIKTGLAVATDPVDLISSRSGFLIFRSVKAPVQRGVVAFVVTSEKLLGEGSSADIRSHDMDVCLTVLRKGQDPVLISGSSSECGKACWENDQSGLSLTIPVFRFGQTYALRMTPDPSWLAAHPLSNGWRVGVIGLFVTFLACSLVALVTNRRVKLERLVEIRTAELKASEEMLRESQLIAGLGSYVLDIPSGLWKSSGVVDQIFGIDEDYKRSVAGWLALIHPGDQEMMRDYFEHEVLGGRAGFDKEYRIIRQNDEAVRWVHGIGRLEADAAGRLVEMKGTIQDITERKQAESYRELGRTALEILAGPDELHQTLSQIVNEIQRQTGCDAAGIRLHEGDDFPYLAQTGFPADFLRLENTLVERGADGGVCRDRAGNICLECTCGLVISGKTDPANPFFTAGGSFWTNNSSPLLELPRDQDPRNKPRNECIHQGYASVALIPIRAKNGIPGLIHLNARKKGFFSRGAVEQLENMAAHIGEALMRKQAENALRESEEKFRTIIEASPVPMVLYNEQHQITFINSAVTGTYGYTIDDVPSVEVWWEVGYPDPAYRQWIAQTWFDRIRQSQDTGEAFVPMEATIRCKNGTDKTVLGSAALVSAFGSTSYLAVLYDITDRKRAEEALRINEARYQGLAQHLETVREEERRRLSRELHDDIGQILTALKIDLMMVHDGCSCGSEVKDRMTDMQRLLSDGIQSVHSLCHRLRPGSLDDLGLDEALSGLVNDWRQRNGTTCEFHADLDDAAISDAVKTAVFRMVQEALTNVSRYAQASQVTINLVADQASLNVLISDNGCGMEPGAADKPTSFGLMGMRERIEVVGGELHIESAPGCGTRIEADIPVAGGGA
jgi:PAS domain S-box-containing protein